jgi:hypothetical protein
VTFWMYVEGSKVVQVIRSQDSALSLQRHVILRVIG